jgi:pimeloyl-ACP methyl ester carboxylesterase
LGRTGCRQGRAATLEEQVDDVLAVLSATTSFGSTILAGGRSAFVAMVAAATHPERLEGLALFGATPTWIRDEELDPENGQLVLTALRAKVDTWARTLTEDLRTPAQRRADALGEICREWLDLADRPTLAGERPHVVVTMDLAALEDRSGGRASLGDVGAVSSETARRLGCDASVTRVITDARSVPLEVGRTTKVVSPALRRALAVRDCGCALPGCERPPGWCDPHHESTGPTAARPD